jgi:lipoprotein-releasing system ATP-binding protein
MNGNNLILIARDVTKNYPMAEGELSVLRGIDLEIKKGEIITVVGPSGVGKSTLLHILGALDRPTRGHVEIEGTNIFQFDDEKLAKFRNARIGFVFQFHHLLPEFSALENVMMPGLIAMKKFNEVEEQATKLLNEVGLDERRQHRPGELSGGEQQRVAVARALINEPLLILADEPSGNLDRENGENLHQLIWHLSRTKNQTFVIVTHNDKLTEKADRVIELLDGRIKSAQPKVVK